jgi:hypothetical protein
LNIQYDVYAKAEADLGWLNSSCDFHTPDEISADKLLRSLSEYLKADLKKASNEIAHMKLLVKCRKTACKLSCTSLYGEDSLEQRHAVSISEGELIINIRANIQLDRLRKLAETALFNTLKEYKGEVKNLKVECFSPSYPKPVYRYL